MKTSHCLVLGLGGVLLFPSLDYQRMKLFDGQNRLIISSHTNVSVTFSVLLVLVLLHMYHHNVPDIMFNTEKNIVIICYIILFYFSTPDSILFFSPPFYVRECGLNESYSFLWPFLDQSSTSTDPLKGHPLFAQQLKGCVT